MCFHAFTPVASAWPDDDGTSATRKCDSGKQGSESRTQPRVNVRVLTMTGLLSLAGGCDLPAVAREVVMMREGLAAEGRPRCIELGCPVDR